MENEIICSSKLNIKLHTKPEIKKYTIHIGAYATEVKRETNPYAVRQKWKRRENGERWKYCFYYPSFKDSSTVMADISDFNVTL